MSLVLISILILGLIGILSAVVLYFAAQKFNVEEDFRIDQVSEVLPGANCGGCGFPGCRGFAEACVNSDDLSGKNCPVGGSEVMSKIAVLLGREAESCDPQIAVVRCNGSCEHRPRTNRYVGAESCTIAASLYAGETGCSFGCLGLGECVKVCDFDAIKMNPLTGLPEVDEEKCTACGACVRICPKEIIQLRKKGPKSRRIYVNCVSRDKGVVTRKACSVGCIGCSKCYKTCPFEAITIGENLAYIDDKKCRLCRKCVDVCPTNSIVELNFPAKKKAEEPAVVVES